MNPKFDYKPHIIDIDLPKGFYAQTALADLDNDGRPEFIVGRRGNNVYWYKYHTDKTWSRHLLGKNSPSDVGACAFDVDGDGKEWKEHIILDINLGGHATVIGDITGNGSLDILTKPWQAHRRNALNGKMYVMFLENLG